MATGDTTDRTDDHLIVAHLIASSRDVSIGRLRSFPIKEGRLKSLRASSAEGGLAIISIVISRLLVAISLGDLSLGLGHVTWARDVNKRSTLLFEPDDHGL